MKKNINSPDYMRIYKDIINIKYPKKEKRCRHILEKKELTAIDIIKLNELIFGIKDKETQSFNQRHRSYSKSDILQLLDYQKKYKLNNIQLANQFNLSRNTVSKWKKMFLV